MRSVKAMLARAMLATIIGTVCVARMASAAPAPLTMDHYSGRWVSQDGKLTLDVMRCGNGLCGVVAVAGGCGHTALRAAETPQDAAFQTAMNRAMPGRLDLANGSLPYGVRVTLARDNAGDEITLAIGGHASGFSPIRRSYDYYQSFARIGDAVCSRDPKTS